MTPTALAPHEVTYGTSGFTGNLQHKDEHMIRPETLIVRAVFTAALTIAAAKGTAQSLINGDFEQLGFGDSGSASPGLAQYVYFAVSGNWDNGGRGYSTDWILLPSGATSLPGWTVGGSGVYLHRSHSLRMLGTSGDYSVELYRYFNDGDYRGGSLAQDITGLKVGNTYHLFFDLRQPSLGPDSVLTVQIGQKSTPILNSTFGKWQTHRMSFEATSEKMSLKFTTPARTVSGILLDKVRVSTLTNASETLSAKHIMGIQVEGKQGVTYRVEYADRTNPAQWSFLTRVTVRESPTWVYDEITTLSTGRFYRSAEE